MLTKETGRFGDRKCDVTVIGDEAHIDRFTEALKASFLTEEEIKSWQEGAEFYDPWPTNITRLVN